MHDHGLSDQVVVVVVVVVEKTYTFAIYSATEERWRNSLLKRA